MKKIVFLDIDGTLKDDQGTISKATIDMIKSLKDAGILIVLCGGRPRYYVKEINELICASKYMITSNGAEIYDVLKEEVIYDQCINSHDLRFLYDMVSLYDARFALVIGNKEHLNRILRNENQELINDNLEELLNCGKVKSFFIMHADKDIIKKIRDDIKDKSTLRVAESSLNLSGDNYSSNEWLSVVSSSVSKGTAIEKLCNYLNIDLKDTVGVGNDYNDIPMFEVVGASIAMNNAHENVKKHATMVTSSNNEDGVAIALKEVLKESI